jgi:hypothetical protein
MNACAVIKMRRQEILLEIGGVRRRQELPLKSIGPKQVEAFARVLREKLLGNKPFAKQYLRLLVSEIRVERDQLTVTGSNAALAQAAVASVGTGNAVPSFVRKWLAKPGKSEHLWIETVARAQLM